jgi:mannose-6-phosphate isomerase
VFDWNRVGLDGKPRALHVAESLASIDFNDFEPGLVEAEFVNGPNFKRRHLVQDPLFNVHEMMVETSESILLKECLRILTVVKGLAVVIDGNGKTSLPLKAGQFCLMPACLQNSKIKADQQTTFLCIEAN